MNLTIAGVELIAVLSTECLAGHGLTVTHKDGALTAPDGRSFGLHNLVSRCQHVPADTWPDLIAAHFGALLAAFPDVPGPLTVEQLRTGTYLRMVPALDPTMAKAYTYATELGASGLHALYAHKDGDMVRWLRDEDIAPIDEDELFDIAKANLRALPYATHTEVVGNTHLTVLTSTAHGFIASMALVLDEIAHAGPLFFAAPTRHTLAYAPAEDDINVVALCTWAEDAYRAGPAPVSPRLHIFNDGIVA
jgi:hypothetical protein